MYQSSSITESEKTLAPECRGEAGPAGILAGAVAAWRMGGTGGSSSPAFVVNGDVQLGVAFTGAERAASVRRGGDGYQAVFAGGFLSLDQRAAGLSSLTGEAMSLYVRVQDTMGAWDAPLVCGYGHDGAPCFALGAGCDGAVPGGVAFTWCGSLPEDALGWFRSYPYTTPRQLADAEAGRLRVSAPAGLVGPTEWHDIVVRFTGPKLQLFVDGVLMDEQYPVGAMHACTGPILIGARLEDGREAGGFHGRIAHVALWGRALTDSEVAALSGGPDAVGRRQAAVLSPCHPVGPMFRPPGHNKKVGDCFPYFDGEVLRLFYLTVRRRADSKWQCGHGGLQVEQMTSKDLVHWTPLPMAIQIDAQWEAWHGTGSCMRRGGEYHLYFPTLSCWPEVCPGGIQRAVSEDGVRFDRTDPCPMIPGGDTHVFQGEDGRYHLVTYMEGRPSDPMDILHYVSEDLCHWQQAERPLLTVENSPTPLYCPDYFEWNGWYYLLAGAKTCIWKSRAPYGPWEPQPTPVPDTLCVPKTAAFHGNRRIMVGWINDHAGAWGGDAVFRELVQDADGNLGAKFPAEMMPPLGEPVSCVREIQVGGETARLNPGSADAFPRDFYLSMTVTPGGSNGIFGLRIRGTGEGPAGCELRFIPGEAALRFGSTDADAAEGVHWRHLSGLEMSEKPSRIEVLAMGPLVHLCVDEWRVATVRDASPGNGLLAFSEAGPHVFSEISVRPVLLG